MNKAKKLLLSLLFAGSIVTTGCSFFGDDTEIYTIKEVKAEALENGDTKVTIIYLDEEQEPLEFIVPKGEDGIEGPKGTGIAEITVIPDEENNQIITITYTDEEMEPVVYTVPMCITITEITDETDEDGNISIIVHYSDGTQSNPIAIPSGKDGEDGEDGEDGNSIEEITYEENADRTITVSIKLTKEDDPVIVTIPAPIDGEDGEDGRGVESMVSSSSSDEFKVVVNYTDGTSEDLLFTRPNKWFAEPSSPKDNQGLNGDLWFNTSDSSIWTKQNNSWSLAMNLVENTVQYSVRFDTDGGDLPSGTPITYKVKHGRYFASAGYQIPVPTKAGYVFKGWYTSKTVTPATGCFTDLTPVCGELTLYAIWEQI